MLTPEVTAVDVRNESLGLDLSASAVHEVVAERDKGMLDNSMAVPEFPHVPSSKSEVGVQATVKEDALDDDMRGGDTEDDFYDCPEPLAREAATLPGDGRGAA